MANAAPLKRSMCPSARCSARPWIGSMRAKPRAPLTYYFGGVCPIFKGLSATILKGLGVTGRDPASGID